jgi:hypothetical protein
MVLAEVGGRVVKSGRAGRANAQPDLTTRT